MTTKRRPRMSAIALGLVGGYCLLVVLLTVFQSGLLYLPQRLSPEESAIRIRGARVDPWRADSFQGFMRQPDSAPARATVVIFHGNAGVALHRDTYTDALVPLGFRVILAEYPGYAGKPGRLDEASLVADAVATLKAARVDFPGPIVGFGESLGAGVLAAALAKDPSLADAAVLLTPWDSLTAVATHHYPYLPVRWMLRDQYDSVANLRQFPGPTAVLLAEDDKVIPAKLGRRLFDELGGRKLLRTFPGADHNSWPFEPDAPWWRELMPELMRSMPATSAPSRLIAGG